MKIEEIISSILLILVTLTDFFIIGTLSLSDTFIIFFLFLSIFKYKTIIPKQTIIFICIATFCLLLSIMQSNPIQYRSYFAAIVVSLLTGIFSKIKFRIYESINFEKVVNLTLLIISFFTLLDFSFITLFNSPLNISGLYGNEARTFAGYTLSGKQFLRPCGLFPEPGDNTSIIAIFISLKIYLNQKFNIQIFSYRNFSILFGFISIMVSKSTFGTLSILLISFYIFSENIIRSNFINNLINKFTIKLHKINKKNLIIVTLVLIIISLSITYITPRILKQIALTGNIDITRFLVINHVFNFDRGLIALLFGTSFEIPNLLINSTTQFVNLFYQFGVFSFGIFYFMLKPAYLHSRRLLLFLTLVFLSKLNISTVPFWLAIYFCNNTYQTKFIKKNNVKLSS